MWRSFFYAIGIGLLLLGGQSLVLDHVVTARKMKVPAAIKEIVNGGSAAAAGQRSTSQPVGYKLNSDVNRPPTLAQPQAQSQVGRLTGGQSRFGPSRFSGPQYGHYGGARTGAFANDGPAFNRNRAINSNSGSDYFRQANYAPSASNASNANAGLIATGSPSNVANNAGPISQRIVQARDWMPWCLLAAGTIVILYTNSWRPRHND